MPSELRGGAKGGLGGYSSPSEHASPRWKVKAIFSEIFGIYKYPEKHILAPSSEESAPRRKFLAPPQSERKVHVTVLRFFDICSIQV